MVFQEEQNQVEDNNLKATFAHDLLNRKEFVRKISGKIEALSKVGGAIAIHSPWGLGKTWLCDHWIDYLNKDETRKLIAIKIDAFLYDYMADPFEVIHQHFEDILQKENVSKNINDNLKKLKIKAFSIGKKAFPHLLKMFLQFWFLNRVPALGEGINNIIEEFSKEEQESLEKIINQYKSLLKDIIKNEEKNVIVFIDELDRCNPKFAIGFFEKLKHYFNVEGIAFVLMINKDQLYKSIHGFYGIEVDGDSYLEKFLSLPIIDLPSHHLPSHRQSFDDKNRPSYKFYEKLISEKFNSLKFADNSLASLSVLSEISELNYREHEQALLLATFYPKEHYLEALDSYFIVMKIKHPSIFTGILEGNQLSHQKALEILEKNDKKLKEYTINPDTLPIGAINSEDGLMRFCATIHKAFSTNDEKTQLEAVAYLKNAYGIQRDSNISDILKNTLQPRLEPLAYF